MFGTLKRLLFRKDSPITSKMAVSTLDTATLEEMVYKTIKSFGADGCISDDVRKIHNGYPYSSITARYSALKKKGYIVCTGDLRIGVSGKKQQVMVASEFHKTVNIFDI